MKINLYELAHAIYISTYKYKSINDEVKRLYNICKPPLPASFSVDYSNVSIWAEVADLDSRFLIIDVVRYLYEN